MPYFLFQWRYKDPAIKAMMETPQDRPAELRKAVEAFGGRMHQFFFAFGGANTTLQTTVLLAPSEGQAAMLRASSVRHGYQSPIGYGSHG